MTMDEQRMHKLDEAARKHTDAAIESYKTVWDLFAQAQESQKRLSQGVVKGTLSYLRSQTEHNLHASEELVEQVQRGEEAGWDLAEGMANAYAQFLDSLFLYHREITRRASEDKPLKGRSRSRVSVGGERAASVHQVAAKKSSRN